MKLNQLALATLTATGPALTPQRGASRAVKISGTAVRISD